MVGSPKFQSVSESSATATAGPRIIAHIITKAGAASA